MTNAHTVGRNLETLGPKLEGLSIKLGVTGIVLSLVHWLSSLEVSSAAAQILRVLLAAVSASLGWVIATIAGVVAAKLLGAIGTALVTLGDIAGGSSE